MYRIFFLSSMRYYYWPLKSISIVRILFKQLFNAWYSFFSFHLLVSPSSFFFYIYKWHTHTAHFLFILYVPSAYAVEHTRLVLHIKRNLVDILFFRTFLLPLSHNYFNNIDVYVSRCITFAEWWWWWWTRMMRLVSICRTDDLPSHTLINIDYIFSFFFNRYSWCDDDDDYHHFCYSPRFSFLCLAIYANVGVN